MSQEPIIATLLTTAELPAKPARYYSIGQIAAAAYLGSPPAAGILLASNFILIGMPDTARQCLVWGWVSVVPLFAVSLALPEDFPNYALPAAYTLALQQFAKRTQSSALGRIAASGGIRHSNWRVFGIGLVCLAIVLAGMIGAIYALPEAWIPAAA